jgi:hypothetical protein
MNPCVKTIMSKVGPHNKEEEARSGMEGSMCRPPMEYHQTASLRKGVHASEGSFSQVTIY